MTCFSASLNVALECYIIFLTEQLWKSLKRGQGISGKEGPEATASLSFPHIHPSTGNLVYWQSACDYNESKFEFFPISTSNSEEKLLYFLEAHDLYRFNYVLC